MAGPQYTECVSPDQYHEPQFGLDLGVALAGLLAAIPTGGVSLLLTLGGLLSTLREVLLYMLKGKLVCLDEPVCAVGRVASFETSDCKPFPEDIDNDFSINIVLVPNELGDFVSTVDVQRSIDGEPGSDPQLKAEYEAETNDVFKDLGRFARRRNLQIGQANPLQGKYITPVPGMPMPRDPEPGSGKYSGYYTDFNSADYFHIRNKDRSLSDQDLAVPRPRHEIRPFKAPVLHCECEGSRMRDLLAILDPLTVTPGLKKFCRANVVFGFLCKVVAFVWATIMSPYIIAALLVAWARPTGGNPDDARLDPESGSLALGDLIVVLGRWAFDAGHDGANEIHAVRAIVKGSDPAGGWSDIALQDACKRAFEAPPVPGHPKTGERGQGLTFTPEGMPPAQQTVYDNQRLPEHRWLVHPAVDGCASPGPGLHLESVDPAALLPDTEGAMVTLEGTGFTQLSRVELGMGVFVNAVKFVNDTVLRANVSVHPDAKPGPRVATVINPGGQRADCPGCFSVVKTQTTPSISGTVRWDRTKVTVPEAEIHEPLFIAEATVLTPGSTIPTAVASGGDAGPPEVTAGEVTVPFAIDQVPLNTAVRVAISRARDVFEVDPSEFLVIESEEPLAPITLTEENPTVSGLRFIVRGQTILK